MAEKLPAGTCSIEGEVSDIRNKLKVQFVKEGSIEKPEVPEMWCSRYGEALGTNWNCKIGGARGS